MPDNKQRIPSGKVKTGDDTNLTPLLILLFFQLCFCYNNVIYHSVLEEEK